MRRKRFTVTRADVHVFCVNALFLRALCELKEAADHSLETQTECAVALNSFSLAASRANIQCSLCVRVRVCVH